MDDDQHLASLLAKSCPRPSFLASSNGGAVLALALHCLMVEDGFVLASEAGRSTVDDARFLPPKDWNGVYLDQWIFEYNKPGKARKFTLHCSLQSHTKRMFIHCSEDLNQANTHLLGLQLDNYVPDPGLLRTNAWTLPTTTPAATPTTSEITNGTTDTTGAANLTTPKPSPSPATVVVNAAKMRALLRAHIIEPLLANAEDSWEPPPDTAGSGALEGAAAATGGQGAGKGAAGWLTGAQRQQDERREERRRQRVRTAAVVAVVVGVAVVAVVVTGRSRRSGAGARWW